MQDSIYLNTAFFFYLKHSCANSVKSNKYYQEVLISKMTKEEFIKTGLCEQYVLKLTTPEESELVEEMLKKYPELKKDCGGLKVCMEKYVRSQPRNCSSKLCEEKSNFYPKLLIVLIVFFLACLYFWLM